MNQQPEEVEPAPPVYPPDPAPTLEAISPYLTERGQLEVELALSRWQVSVLLAQREVQRAASGE